MNSVWLQSLLPHPVQGALSSASSVSREVDVLFVILLVICGIILAVLVGGTGYFLIRYRAGSDADRSPPRFNADRLEIAWILATLLVFLGIGVGGAFAYMRIARPPQGEALEIYVIGRQWMWEAIHPGGRREHNELHVPRGQTVRLNLISEDVIHSFYVPAFRLKHDVVPDRNTSLWFEATENGTYDLFCAEFCGTEHHIMRGFVEVMDPAEYAQWAEGGEEQEALAAEGARLFTSYGCSGCHDPRSPIHAPDLAGVFGSAVYLEEGGFVIADEAYLHDSILLPNKHIVAGYEPVMPTFEGVMPRDDVFSLVEYIKSLGAADPGEEASQP